MVVLARRSAGGVLLYKYTVGVCFRDFFFVATICFHIVIAPFVYRSGQLLAGSTSLVFSTGPGERSVSTRDLAVGDMSIIQFDVSLGDTHQYT